MKYLPILSFLLIALLSSCSTKTIPESRFKLVSANDKAINKAIKKAQDTSDTFVKAVTNKERNKQYTMKIKVEENNSTEHLWVSPVSYNNGNLQGQLASKPHSIRSVKYGDTVYVKPKELSDWAIYSKDNTLLEGGYTIKVLKAYSY